MYKATFLSLLKTARSTSASFQVFSVNMFISLLFETSLTFLLGLLSAVLIAVAFRHLATKSSFYFACFYFYFVVFSRRGYCRLTAIVFATWVAVPFFSSLRQFYCHAIFITAVHFIAAFHSWLDFELPFLLWSCCRHIHFAAKDVFVATTGHHPVFFYFSGCRSSRHFHTVILFLLSLFSR